MVPAYMTKPIATVEEATAFITALEADGRLFHFDDSPETIVSVFSGQPTFTAEECEHLRHRVAEMFSISDFCPFSVALSLI